MRRRRTVFLLALAASALTAAKPVPPEEGPVTGPVDSSGGWRGQAVASCIDRLHAVPELSPDNLEAICGCAANAALEANDAGTLPPVARGQLPPAMRPQLMICTSRIRSDSVADVMRVTMNVPQAAPTVPDLPSVDAKPSDAEVAAPADGDGGNSSSGFLEWVRSFRLPDWLTGASALLWVALGILVFGLLILKGRNRDPRNDLTGPPLSMRRGAPPQPPRRPDLPR